MKIKRVLITIIFVLCLTPVIANAQFVLRYKFTKGTKWVYQTHMMVQAGLPGQPPGEGMFSVHGDGDTTMSIVRVFSNGDARVYATSPNFLLQGSTAPSARNVKVVTYTITPLGKMSNVKLPVSIKGSPFMVSAINPNALATDALVLPIKKVKQGDSWKLIEPNPIRNSAPWQVTTKLIKVSGLKNNRVAVLNSIYNIPITAKVKDPYQGPGMVADGRMILNRTTYFSISEGKMVKTVISGSGKVHIEPYGKRKPERTPMDVIITIQVLMNAQG